MNSMDNIEMKEIKVSKGKALLQFLGRHIVVIYLVVILAILLFGNIAKAESADAFLDNFALSNGFSGSYLEYFNDARSECPYWVLCNSGDLQCIYFCSQPFTEDCFIWNCGYTFIYSGFLSATTYHTLTEDTICYAFCFNYNDIATYPVSVYRRYYSSGTTAQGNLNNAPFKPRYTPTNDVQLAGSSSGYLNTYATYTNSSFDSFVNFGYNSYGFFEATNELISYTSDDRLKLYKLWSSQNGDSLVLDLSDFRTYTAASVYSFSNINVTLSTNGVETAYTLPLANSSVNDGWNNQSNLYTVSTPLSDFTLSDSYDTYVTKVSFDMVTSSPGGTLTQSFYVSTNYPLDLHHSAVTPEVIPTPVYDNPVVKFDVELTQLITELNNKSTLSNNGSFSFVSSDNVPSWADTYRFVLNRYSDNSDSVYAGRYIDGDPNNSSTRYVELEDVVFPIIDTFDNVYDAFIFPVNSWYAGSSVPSSIDDLGITGYLIFYTDRYFQRQESLTDVDILTVLQKDADNFVDFVDYLQKRVDDFELKTTQILNPLYDEVTYVDDKLASLLYAVNSIETYNDSSILAVLDNIYDAISGIGGTDTSNIETKLDTLINHFIANNSQENSAYKQFVTWLRDANGKPVQYVSTGYEFFTELFDYFPPTRDLDGSGGFANMFDMGKGFIDLSMGHTTGIPENYQELSYYFNSANDGTYDISSMSGR